jgi:uncharacterized membrane protein YccC
MMQLDRLDWRRMRGAGVFAFRLTVAALLALWLSYRLEVRLPLWAVLTALIVTQISLGRSLKATLDYFLATIVGVLWGGLIVTLVPHPSEIALIFVMLLALAPLAFAAALYPPLNAGPVTAAIVVLIPEMLHTMPIDSALDRIVEVVLGGLSGLLVSFAFVPWSSFQHAREIAGQALEIMAKAVPQLIAGFERGLTPEEAHRIQDGIGQRLSELSSVIAEAEHERPVRLTSDPMTGPLSRTLIRLRHDLVIIGRAAQERLPASLSAALGPSLEAVGNAMQAHLAASAAALTSQRPPPARDALDQALARHSAEIDAARREGAMRDLSGEAVERLFAVNFALEQMQRNLNDLDRCIAEWAARRG